MNEPHVGHAAVLNLVLGFAFLFLLASCSSGDLSLGSSVSPGSRSIEGTWGGDGVLLTVDASGAVILFGCGGGSISVPLALGPSGQFAESGTFWVGGGADPVGGRPQLPARYEGLVKGTTMELTGTLLDTGESLGTYQLEFANAGTRVGICD